jgi:hypothetical protein
VKHSLDAADEIRVVHQRPRFRGSRVLLSFVDKIPFAFIKRRAYRILLVPKHRPDA